MIQERLSFPNEFRSRGKFVLRSHDKIDWLSPAYGVVALVVRSDTHAQLVPGYTKHDLQFLIWNEPRFPVFSVYMIPE